MVDTTEIIHDHLFLSRSVHLLHLPFLAPPDPPPPFQHNSDFPEDPSQAEALLLDLGITHLLDLSPSSVSAATTLPSPPTIHHHIDLPEQQDALLAVLHNACKFVHEAVERNGRVLVHCLMESRASTVVCAYCVFLLQSWFYIPRVDVVQ